MSRSPPFDVPVTPQCVCQFTSMYRNTSGNLRARFFYVNSTLRYFFISDMNTSILDNCQYVELYVKNTQV